MFWSISVTTFYDPRISQIEKILVKFCPKFLDLYASIYGKKFSVWLLGPVDIKLIIEINTSSSRHSLRTGE
jgi:hypothetical protein